jgi:cytochrome c oxidase subunit 4
MSMSDPHKPTVTDTGAPDPLNYSREVDNPAVLLIVFAAVIGLSLASVGLSSLGLGKLALPMQLAIGAVQAGLVAYHFMHLKQGDKVVILTALASIFWMGILFVLFMADYMTRRIIVGW